MSPVVRSGLAGRSGSSGPSCSSHPLNARGFAEPSRAGGPCGSSDLSRRPALSGISDRELLALVKTLVAQERATTLEILVHLIEVERRKLHLSLGYPSLFEYCARYLGYSSSAAGRRIHAARCVRDFPEVYGLLEKNEVNLITVSLVASILNESNSKDILRQIRRKSQREVEMIVATHRPPVSMRDRARPVCVVAAEPLKNTPVNSGHLCPVTPTAGSEISPNAAHTAATDPTAPSFNPTPRIERKLLVQFLASEAFMKKFEKARALLSNRLGKPSYEAVLETALDEFLVHHDPENRKQRREGRKSESDSTTMPKDRAGREDSAIQEARPEHPREAPNRPAVAPKQPRLTPASLGRPHNTPERTPDRPRHIPAATRDAVFARDKGRCTYVGRTGERCDATHNLQIDHVVPYARGGTSSIENLRLLCARHNKIEAERVYGANSMKRFRARE